MKTRIIEATNGFNWGKFMIGRLDVEYQHESPLTSEEGRPLRPVSRWDSRSIMVFDLATGEGAFFVPGGSVEYDLNEKHQIWVCPMYQPFLEWLYKQDLSDLDALPALVQVDPDQKLSAMYGYRRTRKEPTE